MVTLHRHSTTTAPDTGQPAWRYNVRFIVNGHWRRLTDRNGNPYRIWINAYLKGPDDAPLLAGDKVAILTR